MTKGTIPILDRGNTLKGLLLRLGDEILNPFASVNNNKKVCKTIKMTTLDVVITCKVEGTETNT